MHAMFREVAVIPVVTIQRVEQAVPLARALASGGLTVIEVTLRTEAAAAAIAAIASELPDLMVGAGTVLRAADVSRARDAGAKFLVSPGLTVELAGAGLGSGLPYLPGAVTASEVMAARDIGFSFLKFFPAVPAGGVAALKALAPVFPGVAFCPTGGLDERNAGDFLALPNVPVVGGAWMAPPDLVAAGDWSAIAERAARAGRLRPAGG
jgi:2-dehydro-3-deoxyphosphogluconate aldolase / (4S)-4-hydroxy-2-oxoglutarate aldolase